MIERSATSTTNWVRIGASAGVIAALIAMVWLLLSLHPPARLVLAAGPENGAYVNVARRYAAVLAQDGITVQILETAGSEENAALLASGAADAAILQGGVAADPDLVEAIGTIFFEPMIFLVHRDTFAAANPVLWHDLRISSGRPGSGTAAAYRDFERAVGLSPDVNTHLSLGYDEAVAALAKGQIDMAVFVAPIDAPYLDNAYAQPAIRLLSLDYVDAISRRLEYANTVTLPAGAISLRPVVPQADRKQLAIEARLAVRQDLHPALVNRLTTAAIQLHGVRDEITDPGTFPSDEGTGLPVNNAARQLLLNGPSAWHDWLPYWMAAQVNRMFLLLLPILFIVLPLLRALPGAYAYIMRWRVWQHYPEIRSIEDEVAALQGKEGLATLDARLDQIDHRLGQLRLPNAYRQTAYDARLHIQLIRSRIAELRHQPADPETPAAKG